MEKKNFVSLVMGVVGGLIFALGMVMCMKPEIGNFTAGFVLGIVGAAILLAMVIVRRRMEGKEPIKISGKMIGTCLFAIVGVLVFGLGMVMTMVWNQMLWGIACGVVGIVLLLSLIPLIKGVK